MNTAHYSLLGVLTFLTTVLIGIHSNWLIGGTALLILLWIYAIAALLFKRPRPEPLSWSLVPGDVDNLDQLYQRAMRYCNDIIDHYQTSRYVMRRYYIIVQILTATLSGLTPILVLVDRNETLTGMMASPLQSGLTWAILILPGIAAVLATTSTIFNFQEEWIQAKKTAESLEAVREEFLIGASPQYRIHAQNPETKLHQRKQALDNFITCVNALHLRQIDQWATTQRAIAQSSPVLDQSNPAPLSSPNETHTDTHASMALPAHVSAVTPSVQEAHLDQTFQIADEPQVDTAPIPSDPDLKLTPPQDSSPLEDPEASTEDKGPYLI